MRTLLAFVFALLLVGAGIAFIADQASPQSPSPAPPATDQQIQDSIQQITAQILMQSGIRDKALRDIHEAMTNIDRLTMQLRQLQDEVKRRQTKPTPAPAKEAPKK